MALSFQDNTEARNAAKAAISSRKITRKKKERSPRGALFSN